MATNKEELFECVIPLPDALIRKTMGEPTKSVKHGDHDQSDHGNWAHGGASDRSGGNVAKYIRAHGLQTTVSNGPVPDMRDKERAMWKIKKDTMNNSTLNWDHRNDTPEMRAVRLQERQIETAATILAQGYKGMREVPNDNWRVIELFAPDGSLAAAAMGTLQDQGNGEKAFAMRFFGSLGTVEGAGTAIMAKALEMAADANAEFRLIKVQEGSHAWYQQWGFDTMGTSGAPDMSKEKVAEWVANYRAAATKSLKHGDHDQSDHGNWATGGSAGAGDSKDNPIRTSDVEEAARALGEGKHVQLSSPDQVATLLDRLNELAKEAEAAGSKAKNIDLCNVTVPGTNLFCVESKGIPRVEMPQLKGIPNAGSPASDLVADKRGEVDITEAYLEQLRSSGITLDEDEALASHLKATQNELNGNKVAGIMASARAGELDLDQPIVVSRDGYIVDGHHRWAAKVALEHDGIDDPETDMKIPVVRVDQDILDILESSKQFAADMGLPQVAVKFLKHGDHDQSDHGNWAHGNAVVPKLSATDKQEAEKSLEERFPPDDPNRDNALGKKLGLTNLEWAAADHYRTQGYMEINNLLRGKGSDWGMEYAPADIRAIQLLDEAMDKSTVKTFETVYRGTNMLASKMDTFLSSLEVGGVYTDSSFTSTSRNEDVAESFATNRHPDTASEVRANVMWEIVLPPGTSALDMQSLFPSFGSNEEEVLLDRDTHLRILSKESAGFLGGEPLYRVKAIAIPTTTKSFKHADHDQSDHGSWADKSIPLAKTPIAQVDALRSWSSNSYNMINEALRNPDTLDAQERGGLREPVQKMQDQLDKLFAGVPPTTRAWSLYRGATGDWVRDLVAQYDAMIAKGEEEYRATGKPPTSFVLPRFTDNGFVSTSPNKNVARNFSGAGFEGGPFYSGDGRAIFEINLPEGSKMVNVEEYVNEFGGFPKVATEESEFLLPRGLTFEVTDVTPSDEQIGDTGPLFYNIRLDVVPSSTKSVKHADHDQSDHGSWADGERYTAETRSVAEKALAHYSIDGYHRINSYLRKIDPSDDDLNTGDFDPKPVIKEIDSLFNSAPPLKNPVTVFRGLDSEVAASITWKQGDIYTDSAFMSTSLSEAVSERFTGYGGTGSYIMKIEVPAGTAALTPSMFASLVDEEEVILNRGTTLQITGTEFKDNFNYIYATVVSPTKSVKHADHDQSEHGNWATGNTEKSGPQAWLGITKLSDVPKYKIGSPSEASEPQVAARIVENIAEFKAAGGVVTRLPILPNAGVTGPYSYVETPEQEATSDWLFREAESARASADEYELRAQDASSQEERDKLLSIASGYSHMATALDRASGSGTFIATTGGERGTIVGVLAGSFNSREWEGTMFGSSQSVAGTGSALMYAAIEAVADADRVSRVAITFPESESLPFYRAFGFTPEAGTWESKPNPASVILSRGSAVRIDQAVSGMTPESIVAQYNLTKSIKHGDHDQSDHGSWAHGGNPLSAYLTDKATAKFELLAEKGFDAAAKEWSLDENAAEEIGLNRMQIAAVMAYGANGAADVNRTLRLSPGNKDDIQFWKEYDPAMQAVISARMDEAIAKSSLPEQTILHRGMSFGTEEEASFIKAGSVYTDPGYGSTSEDMITASNFAMDPDGEKTVGVLWKITAPAGYPALPMSKILESGEQEVILARDAHYRIDKVSTTGPEENEGMTVILVKATLLPVGTTKSLKHGDHDQSDHGNWASGGGLRSEESRQLFAKDEPEAYLNKNERETLAREWSTKLGRQVTELDVLSLDNYKRWGSVELNQYLRGQSQLNSDRKEYVQDRVDGIRNLAKPLDRDIVVYRWIPSATSTGEPIAKVLQKAYENGTTVSDSGFMSTSTEVTGGQAWGKNFIAIEVPAGTPVVDFNDWIPSLNAEKEILLMPDTEIMLTYGETLQDGSQRFVASVVSPKTKSVKHGDHDQSDHGNWARGFDAPSSSVPTPAGSKTTVPLWWHERDKTVSLDNMRNGIEAQVREALDAYTHWSADDGYETGTRLAFHAALNERLRAGDSRVRAVEEVARLFADAEDEDLVQKLGSGFMYVDNALRDSKVMADMTVTRASSPIMSIDELEAAAKGAPINIYGQAITPGAVYSDAGIVSTSADMSYQSTQFFAQNWENTEGLMDWQVPTTVRWNINLPAGAPALDLRALGFESQHGESEVLLPRNTHFQIDEVNVELPKFDGAPAKVTVNATVIPTHSTTKP